MTREQCDINAGNLLRTVSSLAGKEDAIDAQSAFSQAAALFAIAEAMHAVASALKSGEKK